MTVFFIYTISPQSKRLGKWLVCGFAEFLCHVNFISLKPDPSYKKKYREHFLCVP